MEKPKRLCSVCERFRHYDPCKHPKFVCNQCESLGKGKSEGSISLGSSDYIQGLERSLEEKDKDIQFLEKDRLDINAKHRQEVLRLQSRVIDLEGELIEFRELKSAFATIWKHILPEVLCSPRCECEEE